MHITFKKSLSIMGQNRGETTNKMWGGLYVVAGQQLSVNIYFYTQQEK